MLRAVSARLSSAASVANERIFVDDEAMTRYLLNIICPAPHNDEATLCACPSLRLAIDTTARLCAVPAVGMGTPCAVELYSLNAKGGRAGVDANRTVRPDGALTRAEAAAIVSRMARTEQRITLWSVSFFSRPAAQDALPAESAASEEAGPLPEEAPSP